MQAEVAQALKLTIYVISCFTMSIRSGEKLICVKDYKSVEISIQGLIMFMDLFLLHKVGSNIVIGIQWLKKLGYFSLNFENLSMQF